MSAIKAVRTSDISTKPFKTFKNYLFQNTDPQDLILTEQSGGIPIEHRPLDDSSPIAHGALALQVQEGFTAQIKINDGLEISQSYYPEDYDGIKVVDFKEPFDWDGSSKRVTYARTKHMYYSNLDNPLYQFGIENSSLIQGEDPFGKDRVQGQRFKTPERRVIHDRVRVAHLNRNVFGEKIRPNTVKLTDFSFIDEPIFAQDDGNTNLIVDGKFFLDQEVIHSPTLIPDKFDATNTFFGKSLESYRNYVAIGNPMYITSLANSKNGAASLFKFDEIEDEWREIKSFASPFTPNGLSLEFGNDSDNSLQDEIGFILNNSEYSKLDGFGNDVAINDDYLAIGAPFSGFFTDISGSLDDLIRFNSTSLARITGSNLIRISANFTDEFISASVSSGHVFAYDKNKGGVDHWGIINIIEGFVGSEFGFSVDVNDKFMAIGAPGKSTVYIFKRDTRKDGDPLWLRIYPSGSIFEQLPEHYFQVIDELTNGEVIIANNQFTGPVPPQSQGDTYFRFDHFLTSSNENFGSKVRLKGDLLLVSSTRFSEREGTVELFEFEESTSIYERTFQFTRLGVTPEGEAFEPFTDELTNQFDDSGVFEPDFTDSSFGFDIDLEPDFIIIGDPTHYRYSQYSGSLDNNGDPLFFNQGAAFILQRGDETWELNRRIFGNDGNQPSQNFLFGNSVSIFVDRFAVGAFPPDQGFQIGINFIITSSEGVDSVIPEFLPVNDPSEQEVFSIGSAFIYKINDKRDNFEFEKQVNKNRTRDQFGANFGFDVELNSNWLFVGAPFDTELLLSGSQFIVSQSGEEILESETASLNPTASFITENVLTEILPIAPDHVLHENNVESSISGSVYIYNLKDLQDKHQLGNVFYNTGEIVITSTASIFKDVMSNSGSGFELRYQGIHTIFENEVVCPIEPHEFNVSTNPKSVLCDPILYDVFCDNGKFDVIDLAYIVEFLSGITPKDILKGREPEPSASIVNEHTGDWWNENIILTENEDILFQDLNTVSNIGADEECRARAQKNLERLDSQSLLDINGDGSADILDAQILTRYFMGKRGFDLVEGLVTKSSTRKTAGDVVEFLDRMTGANNGVEILPDFAGYLESSSIDKTGSYLAPYITGITLYQGQDQVAFAKLGRPIKKLLDFPMNIIIKWDS